MKTALLVLAGASRNILRSMLRVVSANFIHKQFTSGGKQSELLVSPAPIQSPSERSSALSNSENYFPQENRGMSASLGESRLLSGSLRREACQGGRREERGATNGTYYI
jgi:hypothetical protein